MLDADAAEPEAEAEVEAVEPVLFAASWKASKDLAAVGLTAKTIPFAQWLFTSHHKQHRISMPMSKREEREKWQKMGGLECDVWYAPSLATVEPHGRGGVVHGERERGDGGRVGGHGLETGIDTGRGDVRARCSEGGLGESLYY